MPSWVIVGAARGIGFEYVKQLSADSKNTVFALIRSQATAGPLNELAKSSKNIHVLETDTSSTQKLGETAKAVSDITGGKLDVLIYNAYLGGTESMMLPPSAFAGQEEALEREFIEPLKVNAIQQIWTINTFLPLVRKGEVKKIIYITSGMADPAISRVCELPALSGYSISKAAGNIMIAKYAVELKGDGIKTLSLSPGWVETDAAKSIADSPELFNYMLTSFQKWKPSITGMISTEKSVHDQLQVIESLDAEKSGLFLSQHGNDHDWF